MPWRRCPGNHPINNFKPSEAVPAARSSLQASPSKDDGDTGMDETTMGMLSHCVEQEHESVSDI